MDPSEPPSGNGPFNRHFGFAPATDTPGPISKPDFQVLFESAPGLYLVLTPDLTIVAASDAYLQATMTQRPNILGKKIFEVFPDNPEDPSATGTRNLAASMERVLRFRDSDVMAVQKYDIRRPEAQGGKFEERYWSPVNSPVFGREGKIAYIIHRVEDLTEFVRLRQLGTERDRLEVNMRQQIQKAEAEIFLRAQELASANRKLEEANRELGRLFEKTQELDRLKTRFFANVSHEFRTPLTLLLGPLEDLLRWIGEDPPPDWRDRLDLVHRNALRLLKMVNILLDFSRIESHGMEARFEPVDLSAFTAQLAANFHSFAQKAGLEYVVRCEPLPEPFYVDIEMWEKIVFNLLSNAFKFTLSGQVVLSLEKVDGHAELRVRDTGTGIPPQDLPHIFERFYRAAQAKGRIQEGSGIGLSLVKELVTMQGGTVECQSRPGEGSILIVRIPAGTAHIPEGRIVPRSGNAVAAPGPNPYVEEALGWLPESVRKSPVSESVSLPEGPEAVAAKPEPTIDEPAAGKDGPTPAPCILLVEDNIELRNYIRGILEGSWKVQCAGNGEEALNIARKNPPDLVLTDVMMPVMGGLELLSELRRDSRMRTLPIILISARAGEESAIGGLEAGADDYLVKPFSTPELMARVRTHLKLGLMRKKAQEDLRRSEERLRKVYKMEAIGRLAGGIAHDFNNLLTVINGFSALAADLVPKTGPLQGYLQEIRSSADRMAELVKQLLAFARKQFITPRLTSLNRFVAGVEDMVRMVVGERVKLTISLDPDSGSIVADKDQLVQIVLNLALNAQEAMPDGGSFFMGTSLAMLDIGHPALEPGMRPGEYARLTFADTGKGIPSENLDKIFEPFFTTKLTGGGAGLGLSSAQGMVRQSGGNITVKSEPGKGATFEVYFPLVKPRETAPAVTTFQTHMF